MITVHGQTITYFDCDDTLVKWYATQEELDKNGVEFECPGGYVMIDEELKQSESWKERLVPHKKHIEQLKKHKSRHSRVVVWSAAGAEWAHAVVKTLGLEQYVDLCIGKPTWAYDDLPPNEYMPKSQWMKDE